MTNRYTNREPMRVGELLRLGVAELEAAGIVDAVIDVNLLLGHCLALSRTRLYLAMDEAVNRDQVEHFFSLLNRRKLREPIAYILGEREFWSRDFLVTEEVLIPRPETEFLVETVLETVKEHGWPDGLLLDLCCGSGVIGVVLALELGQRVIATDLSAKALLVARHNARRHGVETLIDFVRADLLAPFASNSSFSLIVSNPPYVTKAEMENFLEPEIIRYEPHLALDGGCSGLEVITRIRRDLPRILRHQGWFFMEIGSGQGREVAALFAGGDTSRGRFEQIRILPDYAGLDRVLCARFIKG